MLTRFASPVALGFVFVAAAFIAPRPEIGAQVPRRTAIVEAVEKTRPSTVAIRIPDSNEGKNHVGTGVIIDARGYVVTNRHVTFGKKFVKVRLHDGTETVGEIIAADADFDLAVIRIKTDKKLAAIKITPVADLRVGETVLAVGNPFGYEGTVSRGIISAINRELKLPNDIVMQGIIQHDAAINPGNSGGPLVNANAQVIGINIALRDGAQNIAFAVNATTVDEVLSRLLTAHEIAGVHHGLICQSKSCADDLPRSSIEVIDVNEQSAAARAGIRSGDILLQVAEHDIASRFDVERAFWDKKPGDRVPIKVMRNAEERALMLVLSE